MTVYGYLLLAVGGAMGTLARYAISALALPISRTLPWGTIIINVAGSFIIGFFGTLTLAHGKYPVTELLSRGLYLDMPAWTYHVFEVTSVQLAS